MSDRAQVGFQEKVAVKFASDLVKLAKIVDKHTRLKIWIFLKSWIQKQIVKWVLRRLGLFAAKLIIREVAILAGATITGLPSGGTAAPVVFLIGNVILIIWTVVDIAQLGIELRTYLRERKKKQAKREKPDFTIKGGGKVNDPDLLDDLMDFVQQSGLAQAYRAIRREMRAA